VADNLDGPWDDETALRFIDSVKGKMPPSDMEEIVRLHHPMGMPEPLPWMGSNVEFQKQGVKALVPMLGATTGGFLGREVGGAAAEAIIPKLPQYLKWLRPFVEALGQPVGAGVGEGAGSGVGSLATGATPSQALMNAIYTSGTGTALEGGLRLGARGLAPVVGVSPEAAAETFGRRPLIPQRLGGRPPAAVMLGRPDASEALALGQDLASQLRPAPGVSRPGAVNLTETLPARQAARNKLRQFDAANPVVTQIGGVLKRSEGVPLRPGSDYPEPTPQETRLSGGIDSGPLKDKLLSMVKPGSLEEGQQRINDYLRSKAASLPGRMSAQELDDFILEHRKPISGTYGQQPLNLPTQVKQRMLATAKQMRDLAVPEAVSDFATASRQRQAMKDVAARFLTKTGQIRPGGVAAIKGILSDPATEDLVKRLEAASPQYAGSLEEMRDLATRSEWTKAIEFRGWHFFTGLLKGAARLGAKGALLGAAPAGQVGAAAAAFTNAMNQPIQERSP
jgi:hypothetical protein